MRTLSTVVLGLLYFMLSATNLSAAEISYSDHCSSIVPESRPTARVRNLLNLPLYDLTANYYFWGGEKILGSLKKSSLSESDTRNLNHSETHVSFRPVGNVLRTDTPGVYKLEALLVFRLLAGTRRRYRKFSGSSGHNSRRSRRPVSLRFFLQGFWSEQSRRLCMVGASKSSMKFSSVFELTFGDGNSNSSIFTSLAKGSLRSLNPSSSSNYFDAIKIVSVPYLKDYNYTMNCLERSDLEVPPEQSLSLQKAGFCSIFQYQTYEFEWETASVCNASQSQDCGPFEGRLGPSLLSLSAFQCSDDEEKLRYILHFKDRGSIYTRALNPDRTYIGEGTWDSAKNHLCIAACRILNSFKDLSDVTLGDCSIRVSLRFPVVWTVRDTSNVVGVGWSSRTTMRLRTSNTMNNGAAWLPGLRYEYTETDKVRGLCPNIGNQVRKSGELLHYPKGDFYDMRFQMSAKHGKEQISYGYAVPIAVGNELYGQKSRVYVMDSGYGEEEEESSTKHISQMNVSYKFSFTALKFQDKFFSVLSSGNYAVEVSAEGVYDSATGNLCMVGCRGIHGANTSVKTLDCEILMRFEFPALDSKVGSSIKGFIESRRGKDDSLYFNPLNISSESYYGVHLKKSIWRMDLEIILVLISNTLLCAFVVSQIFYVNKHPEAVQSISLVMLIILTIGRMIPLVLNLEALLLKSHDHQQEAVLKSQGSSLEFNEVSVRLVSLVAFLLLLRLLQMAWSGRNGNGSEKKPAIVSFVLYGIGGVIALLVEWNFSSESVLKCLKSYGGLVLDGFLLPQIILNVFQNPAQKSLSCWFYMGTTLVRLFPHAYDFYRVHYYRNGGGALYFYANPNADFYSIAWDVAIPIGCVLLAVIVWVQQRFGARRVLPEKVQELSLYEKVPTEAVISE